MLKGKRIERRCTKISGQHRAAEGNDVMQRQQPKLDDREIAVAAYQQRVLLLTLCQTLPVNALQ